MAKGIQKERPSEFFVPTHSSQGKNIDNILSRLIKGSSVWIVPLSVKQGDENTAQALNCTSNSSSLIEMTEPFQAYIEDYDGRYLRLRSDRFYCLKMDIRGIKDLILCTKAKHPIEEVK